MKFLKYTLIVVTATTLLITAGCSEEKKPAMQEGGSKTTTADIKKEAKDLVETTKSYTMEQKEAYEKELADKFAEYSRKISALKQQLAMTKGEAQKEMQQNIDMLQAKLEDMRNRAKELKDTSGQAWDDLKKGLDKAVADLDEAFTNAMQSFKQQSSKY